VTLQLLCEFATLYWELDNVTEAQAVQAQMKGFPLVSMLSNSPPITRSRYLCTMDCVLIDGIYRLVMRINRDQPSRKEGEPLEDTETMKRKVERCFLDVTFEATEKDGRPVTIAQSVDKPHHFEVTSPQMGQADPGRWYEVAIDIFADEKHENKLGVHHQLVYATPPSNYIGRTSLGNF